MEQFPKTCHICGKRFETYEDWHNRTTPLHDPKGHSLAMGLEQRNCDCGDTHSISVDANGVPLTAVQIAAMEAQDERETR